MTDSNVDDASIAATADQPPRRRRRRWITFGIVAVVCVALAVTFAVRWAAANSVPAGYKLVRASGVAVAVPSGWHVTDVDPDSGCGAPTIALLPSPSVPQIRWGTGCLRVTNQSDAALLGMTAVNEPFSTMPYSPVIAHIHIGGHAAVRGSGIVGLGGPHVYEGFVILSSPKVSLYVRTQDDKTLTTILDSVRLT